jgi:hypothetical protein
MEMEHRGAELGQQLCKTGNGCGGGGQALVAAAGHHGGQQPLVRRERGSCVVVSGQWGAVGGPEHGIGGLLLELGLEQLLHEQLGAAGDAGVVVVAEVEQAHQKESSISAP